ncbi:histone-binding protein RBBP4 [Pancytospora epiphaga]|nr:histone-binding protein RBBP4 [Pancytospora epiphaga]
MNQAEGALLDEEYKIWRKNVPYLYDMMYTQVLKWSSPSIQWFPTADRVEDRSTLQKLLMTTFTSGKETEHLLFAQATFPDMVDEDSLQNADIKFKFNQSIPIPSDVNRARMSPHAVNVIACRTSAPDVLIYDYTKHSSANSALGPDASLSGHKTGGFALDWNPNQFGELASGGEDKLVNIFDINKGVIATFSKHESIVNDVSYSRFNPKVLSSVSDDMKLVIHDLRGEGTSTVLEKAHFSVIDTCAFSPHRAELLVTGAADNTLKVWDVRNTIAPAFLLRGHKDPMNKVAWSPHYESILASAGKDRRVILWDLNKSDYVGDMESSEILFIHGGHTDVVDDFDWNPTEPLEIASVSADGMLHIWKISLEDYL